MLEQFVEVTAYLTETNGAMSQSYRAFAPASSQAFVELKF